MSLTSAARSVTSMPAAVTPSRPYEAAVALAPVMSRSATTISRTARSDARSRPMARPMIPAPPSTTIRTPHAPFPARSGGCHILAQEVLAVAAGRVGQVAHLDQVRVLVPGHLVQAPADAAPGGVAEGAGHEDVAAGRR